jgi:hypothetical protein
MKAYTLIRDSLCKAMTFGSIVPVMFSPAAWAKEPSLMAIELYGGSAGAAYIQIQNVLINGKSEMRDCSAFGLTAMGKSAYNKLEKLLPASGGVVERGNDGVLRYSVAGGKAVCVVPANMKFEHSETLSPAAMAENIPLKGDPIAPGSDGATGAKAQFAGWHRRLGIRRLPGWLQMHFTSGYRSLQTARF